MEYPVVDWPWVTIAVTQICTLAVVVANAYYRIAALRDAREENRVHFEEQNRQLDRVEAAASSVAAITPILAAAAASPPVSNSTITVLTPKE